MFLIKGLILILFPYNGLISDYIQSNQLDIVSENIISVSDNRILNGINNTSRTRTIPSVNDTIQFASKHSGFVFIEIGNRTFIKELQRIVDQMNSNRVDFVESAIKQYSEFLYERGFLNNKIEIREVVFDESEHRYEIQLFTETGPEIIIDKLVFTGLRRLSQDYLLYVSGFKSGLVASSENIHTLEQLLISSGAVKEVNNITFQNRDASYHVIMDVEETDSSVFDGLIGYNPNPSSKNSVVGYFNIQLINLFTSGNQVYLKYERIKHLNSKLEVSLSQKRILGKPYGMNIGFGFFNQDSTFQRRTGSILIGYTPNTKSEFNITVIGNSTTSGAASSFNVRDARSRGIVLGYLYDNSGNVFFPVSGYRVKLVNEYHSKVFLNQIVPEKDAGYILSRYSVHVNPYIFITQKLVTSIKLEGIITESPVFYMDDYVRIGGASTIRGFREEQWDITSFVWGETEFRYLLDKNTYSYIFSGFGAIERKPLPSETGSENKILYSSGMGFTYKTNAGVLKISYAISNITKWYNGMVHFGLNTGF